MSKLLVDQISDADNTGPVTVTDGLNVSSGNVGIGTSSPSGKLDVVGDIKTSGEYVINSGTTAKWTLGQSSDALYFYSVAAGTERMRLLPSGGITFNGDTAAANALDDYEEGTYMPTVGGSAAAGTCTYGEQAGTYTKIGNMVRFSGSIQYSSHSGATGAMVISLPFATSGAPTSWQGNFTLSYQLSFSVIGYVGYTDPGRADFFIRIDGSPTGTIGAGSIPGASHLIFGGTFQTSS